METLEVKRPKYDLEEIVQHQMFGDMLFTVDKRFYLETTKGEIGWRYYLIGVRTKKSLHHAVREEFLRDTKPNQNDDTADDTR